MGGGAGGMGEEEREMYGRQGYGSGVNLCLSGTCDATVRVVAAHIHIYVKAKAVASACRAQCTSTCFLAETQTERVICWQVSVWH